MAIDTQDATVTRGNESWTYIYIILGFTLSIEGTIIGMATRFPWNLIVYLVMGITTFWLFICSGRFQNRLIGWKQKYEGRAR